MKKALTFILTATLIVGLTPGIAHAGKNWRVEAKGMAITHKIRPRTLLMMEGRWYEVSFQAHDDCSVNENFPACVSWYGRKSRSLFTDKPSHFAVYPVE